MNNAQLRHQARRRQALRRAHLLLLILLLALLVRAAVEPALRDAEARRSLRLARRLRRSAPGAFRPNTDPAARLQLLPGIGPALARRMVAYRRRLGPFRSHADLSLLPGLGKNQVQPILPLLDMNPR